MPLRGIGRISGTDVRTFRSHIAVQQPVIIQRLFGGQVIDRLRTKEAVLTRFGHWPLSIVEEYSSRVRKRIARGASPSGDRRMSLQRYVMYVKRHPGTRKLCTKMPLPCELRECLTLPPHVEATATAFLGMNLFVANRGNVAHMHVDSDYNLALLYQVYGRKRVVLLPPTRGAELQPTRRFSGIHFQDLSVAERRRTFARLGAFECVIRPTDTLFIPVAWWHYVEYVDDGMSFNMRFGESHAGGVLRRCGDTVLAQTLAARFARHHPTREQSQLLKTLEDVLAATVTCADAERARTVEAVLAQLDATMPGGRAE